MFMNLGEAKQQVSRKQFQEGRWLELHHRRPRALGGEDALENLVVLCRGHHQAWHSRYEKRRSSDRH